MHDWFFFQFREHNSHRRYLFKTYPNALVYCSPTSTFWGVGLSKGEKEVQDPSKWKGKNKLGELLTKIRDEMMQDQNLVFDVPGSGSGNGNTTTTTTTAAEAPRGRKRPLSPKQQRRRQQSGDAAPPPDASERRGRESRLRHRRRPEPLKTLTQID